MESLAENSNFVEIPGRHISFKSNILTTKAYSVADPGPLLVGGLRVLGISWVPLYVHPPAPKVRRLLLVVD